MTDSELPCEETNDACQWTWCCSDPNFGCDRMYCERCLRSRDWSKDEFVVAPESVTGKDPP